MRRILFRVACVLALVLGMITPIDRMDSLALIALGFTLAAVANVFQLVKK